MKKFLLLFVSLVFLSTAGCDDPETDPAPVCGDGTVNGAEECDTTYTGTDTCTSLGYYAGEITCSNTCTVDISQCTAAGMCGDGIVNGDENEENCCGDTGCETGVCTESGCMAQWELDCAAGPGCSDVQPWECSDTGLPTYDCAECGCPGDLVCEHSVCYSQEELDAFRQSMLLPLDQELDWYFTLMDTVMSPSALSYNDFAQELEIRLRSEERLTAVLFGESHGSTDEQNVHMQIMMDIESAGWEVTRLGMEDNGSPLLDATQTEQLGFEVHGISGDLTNTTYCNDAKNAADDLVNHVDGIYFQYTGSGHTSREIAKWPMHWGVCTFPHTAECVLSVSRMAITVIAFDPNVWMTLTDQMLMWRIGDFYDSRDSVTTALSQTVGRWDTTFSMHAAEPGYDATVNGEAVNVRFIPSSSNPDVWFAFFPRPNRQAWLTRGFQTIWSNQEIQDFLWDRNIKPGNCSVNWNFTPGEEELTYFCHSATEEVEAHVNGITFELISHAFTTL
ncbi:hypothetical protein KKF34_04005 [Myxococcota bacterium]|nr:hypothetical protein [Myxococcota bacterium]MBU1381792.1 hypothetical protein [Myxococcota bacterium]MBU1496020.1 hypothetical protein [Myxococcota bacterium]